MCSVSGAQKGERRLLDWSTTLTTVSSDSSLSDARKKKSGERSCAGTYLCCGERSKERAAFCYESSMQQAFWARLAMPAHYK